MEEKELFGHHVISFVYIIIFAFPAWIVVNKWFPFTYLEMFSAVFVLFYSFPYVCTLLQSITLFKKENYATEDKPNQN